MGRPQSELELEVAIGGHAYHECAAALRRVAPRIIARWEDQVRDQLPGLDELTGIQLVDALPCVLEDTAASLEHGRGADRHLVRESKAHAHQRFELDVDLEQTLLEYELLREVLPRELNRSLGRPLEVGELIRVNRALDICVRSAVTVFTSRQRERIRAEAEAMTKYLSFLSHDLRGNLNGAMLMIEVLRRELQSDERFGESVDDLDAMRHSMLELVATMDRFLQAERLRQGRVEVSLQLVDINQFLHEQRRQMGRQVRGADEQIEVVCDGPQRVRTDRELLTLIVQNTLGNCVKYSIGGMVGIRAFVLPGHVADAESAAPVAGNAEHLSTQSDDGSHHASPDSTETQGWLRIEVSDTGPGMESSLQEKLFNPFTRGLNTGKPGTGLGLFIAKQAADLIGARLHVESELGCGTLFLIDLPLIDPAEARSIEEDADSTPATPA